jgi:hypothetical protein
MWVSSALIVLNLSQSKKEFDLKDQFHRNKISLIFYLDVNSNRKIL